MEVDILVTGWVRVSLPGKLTADDIQLKLENREIDIEEGHFHKDSFEPIADENGKYEIYELEV